ncbi:NAD(FAD)-dependent dehydrogenase [filamentous cyanobacterium CCP5]|nr:NAD(FAD)-dependent dehydrogenase [filamentous cyanobacterium CCP5]
MTPRRRRRRRPVQPTSQFRGGRWPFRTIFSLLKGLRLSYRSAQRPSPRPASGPRRRPLSPAARASLRRRQAQRRLTRIATLAILGSAILLAAFRTAGSYLVQPSLVDHQPIGEIVNQPAVATSVEQIKSANGRPTLSPLPVAEETWQCQVVVIGGSLGGVAAASHAMQTGATTCLIELTPWLGGQISSQGVSAIDESRAMRYRDNFSPSWEAFKRTIRSRPVYLPGWSGLPSPIAVSEINSCWVGELCFPPRAGATAAEMWMRSAAEHSPKSRWSTSTAFKGAAFDASGRNVTAVYAVKRTPRSATYAPQGKLSAELLEWYAWGDDEIYDKTPIRLEAPPGERLLVIDATDTGELVGWANFPHRVGSDAQGFTGEVNAASKSNPDCTQAYTYPFVLSTIDDGGTSYQQLKQLKPSFPREEFQKQYDLERFPFFHSSSVFNYRRIVSSRQVDAALNRSHQGEMSMINWNRGNDWHLMDPPLIFTEEDIALSGQHQNWIGGISVESLKLGEENSLLFAEWLIETHSEPDLPLTFLSGPDAPLGTHSGLSMVPYIREGRRILGRPAYGQDSFMLVESDLREDMTGGRNFSPSAVALAHYDIDIHGCRYRDNSPTYEASSASIKEFVVRPLQIPLEALIPQGVDNVMIGGKSIAVSHIVNGVTRVHYGEWSIGAAAGATAGWLLHHGKPADLTPAQIVVTGQMPFLQQFLINEGLKMTW